MHPQNERKRKKEPPKPDLTVQQNPETIHSKKAEMITIYANSKEWNKKWNLAFQIQPFIRHA